MMNVKTIIKTAEKIVIRGLPYIFLNKMESNCKAERHHYSMFNVGRFPLKAGFDVHLLSVIPRLLIISNKRI